MINVKEESQIKEIVKKSSLNHIAIIMDGNRRWAKENNLPSMMGHTRGVEALKNIVKACHNFGVKYLTVYAFSTENWNRKESEVNFLMDLLGKTIQNEFKELNDNGVKLKFIGDIKGLNPKLQEILLNAEENSKENKGVNLQIAINYGAKDEIVNAVKKIVASKIKEEEITEDLISDFLYTKNIPNPDLLIRTGGEKRISNYLLWQIAYSEIYVTQRFWPDFNEDELIKSIQEFSERQRRYGA